MRTGFFEMNISGGYEDEFAGTVRLPHRQTFTVTLTNHLRGQRCNVHLSFNGKAVGEFRVNGGHMVVIKRPVHNEAPFTFLQVGTAEAKAAGLPLDGTAGLLKATFIPEATADDRLRVEHESEAPSYGPALSREEAAELTAAFGLSAADTPSVEALVYFVGKDGNFQEADDIFTLDEVALVTVELRLQGEPDESLSLDPFDVFSDETARLEYQAEKACADFDYDLAFKLGREVRAREREMLRHWQGELRDVRRQLEHLQAGG